MGSQSSTHLVAVIVNRKETALPGLWEDLFFVASFVAHFVDKAPDKARDKVSGVTAQEHHRKTGIG